MTRPSVLTVLCCRPDPSAGSEPSVAGPPSGDEQAGSARPDAREARAVGALLDGLAEQPRHFVGRRPGKWIDPLLTGRLLVIGDDADLAAVVLRLLRREVLGLVELAYAPVADRTPVTDLWDLPLGRDAVRAAADGQVDPVPLVRDDVGGVLLGRAEIGPVNGVVYVDELCLLRGHAQLITVRPDRAKGLTVTITNRRQWPRVGRRLPNAPGRAVQFGMTPTTVVSDGVTYPRPMDRWTFYLHTQPLQLIRGR